MTERSAMPSSAARRARLLACLGLASTLVGVVGYFVLVLRYGAWLPRIRNDAIPNWILVALGLVLAVRAVRVADRRLVPALLLALNVVVAGAFAAMLYVASVVPPAPGPKVGAPAPAFALVDQSGRTVRLEDFRGAPLVLVFYRGHW